MKSPTSNVARARCSGCRGMYSPHARVPQVAGYCDAGFQLVNKYLYLFLLKNEDFASDRKAIPLTGRGTRPAEISAMACERADFRDGGDEVVEAACRRRFVDEFSIRIDAVVPEPGNGTV